MRHSTTSSKKYQSRGSVSVTGTQILKAVKLISFSYQFIFSLFIPKIFVDCLPCARLWSRYFEGNNKQSSTCSPRAWNWGVERRKEKGREKVIYNPIDVWMKTSAQRRCDLTERQDCLGHRMSLNPKQWGQEMPVSKSPTNKSAIVPT